MQRKSEIADGFNKKKIIVTKTERRKSFSEDEFKFNAKFINAF